MVSRRSVDKDAAVTPSAIASRVLAQTEKQSSDANGLPKNSGPGRRGRG
jgi:hypothetical protein